MYQQQWGSNYQSNAPARRQAFISRVYGHLAGGFLVFAVIEGLLLNSPIGDAILAMVFGFGQIGWLILMGIFMLISWIARSKLASSPDPSKQYLGYGLYILIEAVVFLPLLYIANSVAPGIVPQAATMTGALFLGLTAVAFGSKMRFNFLGPILGVGGLVLLGVMVTGMIFGFSLGLWFSAIMIAFAGGAILYDTDRVMNEYNERDHVAAALELFASVALLLWYVIRILLQLRGRD